MAFQKNGKALRSTNEVTAVFKFMPTSQITFHYAGNVYSSTRVKP
jgi:hypothetical protein